MSFAGAMKNEKQKLELLKSKIAAEREANSVNYELLLTRDQKFGSIDDVNIKIV